MEISSIIEQAKDYALKEIELYGDRKFEYERFFIAHEKGQELADKLGADKDIVALGTIFMDLKLWQCLKEGKASEHIKRSSIDAQNFLQQYNLPQDTFEKVVNCIEAHHGTIPYICKEAEICANADGYKFLNPRGFLVGVVISGRRDEDFDSILTLMENKIEEKYNILSLDICKQELEAHYHQLKEFIKQARK